MSRTISRRTMLRLGALTGAAAVLSACGEAAPPAPTATPAASGSTTATAAPNSANTPTQATAATVPAQPTSAGVAAASTKFKEAPMLADQVKAGTPDRVVGTSKTIRSLARLTGAAPSSAGPRVRRTLTDAGLRQVIAFISRMSADDLAGLEGVSASRSRQLVAGALVVQATMRALGVDQMDLCPWALREGVILRRLDWLDWLDGIDRTAQLGRRPPRRTGRTVARGAR